MLLLSIFVIRYNITHALFISIIIIVIIIYK